MQLDYSSTTTTTAPALTPRVLRVPHGCPRLLLGTLALALISAGSGAESTGRRTLFDGQDLAGWRSPVGEWRTAAAVPLDPTDATKFALAAGSGILVNGEKGRTVNLLTEAEHGDVELHVEFVVPKGSNSGVYLQGRYEIQILDSWGVAQPKSGDCGGVYASCSEPKPDFAGRPPEVNASRPPGEWQTYDIVFRAPRFDAAGKKTASARFVQVRHNGKLIHENIEVPRPTCAAAWLDERPTGPVLLQGDHGPVAYRNLWWRPLQLP
ncbi:MAG: DUF1080 domain-containing protein [Verrucomicrobia bacterium]|nr:DUF1080 domain-containing protein [Verrucomicrobiota bacterium]